MTAGRGLIPYVLGFSVLVPAWNLSPAAAGAAVPTGLDRGAGQGGRATGQRPPQPPASAPFFWWRNEEYRSDLGLTDAQVAQLQAIWDRNRDELAQLWTDVNRQQREVDELVAARAAVATVFRQVDALETHRMSLQKTRTMMLYEMDLVLSPEQQRQLSTIAERERDRGGRRGGEPR